MPEPAPEQILARVEEVYRTESRRVLATLIRLLGDFDLAEEAMAEAFAAASDRWPREGEPSNPRAWLVSTGRFKAIDALRRRARFNDSLGEIADRLTADAEDSAAAGREELEDDRLRLIFTCCHPALAPAAQVALTLREVCGLTTEEIARAFLSSGPTLAQRIVRAKAKIRDARIPYRVPAREEVPDRLDAVLQVVYLVFNEGYSASSGESLTRADLSGEAIRLGRLLVDLMPEPEAMGLLALMLLHESRRTARSTPDGEVVLLDDQDRSLWNREQIAEGLSLVDRALASRRFGPYTLQAAIAAVHAQAAAAPDTDWAQIVALYDVLLRVERSPVIELNRAVAVAMRDGPAAGLALVDAILARGELGEYQFAHAARAELCRRLGRKDEARAAFERALELARQEPERSFLRRRLRELGAAVAIAVMLCAPSVHAQEPDAASAPSRDGASSGAGQRPAAPADAHEAARRAMIETIERYSTAGPQPISRRVLDVMARVPRHEFVPEARRDSAYADTPLPIGHGQTISQPYIVALMTELADVDPGDVVLEIGTGSGYQAAVLSGLAAKVFTIEIVGPLAAEAKADLERLGHANVTARAGDGYKGWPEHAPFDAVLVTAAPEHIPQPLIEQLGQGGTMVVPVGSQSSVQRLTVIEKQADGRVTSREVLPVRFVPLTRE